MNGMAPELKIMLNILIEQRQKIGYDDFFEFNFKDAQRTLNTSKASQKYGIISSREQKQLLHQLDENGIIKMNYVEKNENDGAFSLSWKHDDTEWVFDGIYNHALPYEAIEQLDGKYFIHLSVQDIKDIYKKYLSDTTKKTIKANLEFKNSQFIVVVEEHRYRLPTLHQGTTLQIIEIVMANIKNPPEPITRESLRKEYGIKTIGNKSLIANVFAKCTIVKDLLASFIAIGPDSILVTPNVMLSESELDAIIEASIEEW